MKHTEQFVALSGAWTRRSWGRIMLSVLGCIGGVILSGTAATSTGYFVFTLLGAACLVAIADARRRLAQLSQDERADGLAIHPRDQTAFGRAREEACSFSSIRSPMRYLLGWSIGFYQRGGARGALLIRRGSRPIPNGDHPVETVCSMAPGSPACATSPL
jgi:hypothetical protein